MKEHALVVWWLRVVAMFVVATLVVGGVTRLTDSGLSITEWEPILGVIPPLSEHAWQSALELYRQIPEYQLINRGMSLSEFQSIYLWEWSHRLIARSIGLVFLVPFLVFWLRGMLPGWFKPWGVALLALGGLQGAVGWWMVTSGLTERVDVSQYRLAVHMTLACIILALTVWLSERLAGRAGSVAAPRPARSMALAMPLLILCQIALGALVAGLDAGLASDSWPLMAGKLVPDGMMVLSPAWLNLFENPLTVQFDHRLFGYFLALCALFNACLAWRAGAGRRSASLLVAVMAVQVMIGVLVVVTRVPPVLAGVHQLTAAILLWIAVAGATRVAARSRRAGRALEPVTP